MSPHHTDQMSQWSQVFRIALCITKVKVTDWVSDWVSEWVTRSPIELFWTAKKEKFCRGERAISQQGPLPLPHSGSIAFCSNTSFSVSYFISPSFQHWHRSHTCWIRLHQLLIHLLILLHHLHLTRWKTCNPLKRDVRLISAATETGPHPIGDSHYFLTH